MLITQKFGTWLGACIFWIACVDRLEAREPDPAPHTPSLAVLDPVDLGNPSKVAGFGDVLRSAAAGNRAWRLIPKDTLVTRFREYRMDPAAPCREFQCAFDAGNVLAADFVVYGTVTPWRDMYAYTLNVLCMHTSRVVWSRAGEAPRKPGSAPAAALEKILAKLIGGLGLDGMDGMDVLPGPRHGLLTVVDFSPKAGTSGRIMVERATHHLYASRNFDIMSQREQEELLSALNMRKSVFALTDSGILAMGGKMDVTHLVYTRLAGADSADPDGGPLQLRLALYDIAAGKKVREWPSPPSADLRKIMSFEDKFFASLLKTPEFDGARGASTRRTPAWAWGGAGLGVALTAAFGLMAWSAQLDAERNYRQYRDARSRETALAMEGRATADDRKTRIYGALGAASLAGAGAMVFFAF